MTVASRLRRRAAPDPPPPATGEASWLTAEAYLPAVAGQGPCVGSNTAPAAPDPKQARALPPRRASGRGPKRRRWAMPASPAERRAEPVDPPPPELHVCPFCRTPHQPFRMPGGVAVAYARPLDYADDPYRSRPMPLSRAGPVHDLALRRDSFNPWRASPAEPPPTPTPTIRERFGRLWSCDLPDH
jgi:hypothetical protein